MLAGWDSRACEVGFSNARVRFSNTRFSSAKPPDTPTVKKELERHALVAREPGGGGFVALSDGLEKGVAKLVRD